MITSRTVPAPSTPEHLAHPAAPRWASRLAHVIPLLVLPSGLWRLAAAFGFSTGQLNDAGQPTAIRGWAAIYIAVISLIAEAFALTGFGLVQPVGREIPRWAPVFGGRAVRPKIVVTLGTLGSVALMLIWTVGFWPAWVGDDLGYSSSWAQTVFTACYAPLNLWGPALLVLTFAFWRRAGRTIDHESPLDRD